jgi:stringent starvation protein B
MLSNKPYLIRAFYEWIVDSACTPFLVINANAPRCRIPLDRVENGEITLNIAPSAIRDLKIGNDLVEFRASFSGTVFLISAPIRAVLAIYAQENQEGMFFDYEEAVTAEEEGRAEGETNAPWAETPSLALKRETAANIQDKKKPTLKLVE